MKAFISYSHKDEAALNMLHKHMAVLRSEGLIEAWHDREILAGDNIDAKISEKLETSNLFLLLISPDFLNSDYCAGIEMQRALQQYHTGEARVVPIIIKPCDWQSVEVLRNLKALPKDGIPISTWTNEDEAWLNVVEGLRQIINTKADRNVSAVYKAPPFISSSTNANSSEPIYRAKRKFNEIEREEFCDKSFATIKDYFASEIEEINKVATLQAQLKKIDEYSFGATIINTGLNDKTAHITVNAKDAMLGDMGINYAFQKNAPSGSVSGSFKVDSDDFELFFTRSFATLYSSNESSRFSAEQLAHKIWIEYIEQAGIKHA